MQEIFVLMRCWESWPFLEQSIHSVLAQKLPRQTTLTILFVDDHSDYTAQQRKKLRTLLTGHIVQFNTQQKFAVRNAYEVIHQYVKNPSAIIINLDGDDWLIDNTAVQKIVERYRLSDCLMTYGNCRYFAPGSTRNYQLLTDAEPLANRRYPKSVELQKSFRRHFFLPNHLRSWRAQAFLEIPKHYFLRANKSWLQLCEDEAIFFPMLEKAANRYEVIKEPLSAYNVAHPFNDQKFRLEQQLWDEVCIRRKPIFT